jgi:cytosine/adenosine deaminase-related metal-dependent hydrolase
MLMNGSTVISNGAIALGHGSILAIGPADQIIKQHSGHRLYQFDNAALMPGLVNTHTHLELPPLLDGIRAESFPDWVLNLIKLKKKLVSKNYAASVKNNIEILKHTGTTTVGEICTHGISPAYLKLKGMRALVFHEIISMGSGVRGQGAAVSKRVRDSGLIRNGLSPHAPYTVSEAILRKIKQSADKREQILCMHVSESNEEIKLLLRKRNGLEKLYKAAGWDLSWAPSAGSPFEYLHRIELLSPHFLAVHAVQVRDNDIRLIKKSGTSIAHCPRSNKETNVGRMPLKKFLDAGITVGLGTDSLASSPSLNMWDEMRYAFRIHKKDGITAEDIFRLATIGGAKALGMDKEIGTLEPGKKADIIAVPLPKKNTGDLYSDLLRETKSCIMSIVNGKILYKEP